MSQSAPVTVFTAMSRNSNGIILLFYRVYRPYMLIVVLTALNSKTCSTYNLKLFYMICIVFIRD